MIKNDAFLKALQLQKTNHSPIWIMRQAGRYLPEYRQLRQKAGSFLNLCKNPNLAAQVSLQPIKRFNLDAAIIFSDILIALEALAVKLKFIENLGPVIENPINTKKQIEQINKIDIDPTVYQHLSKAIKLTKIELNNQIPLIGFCGSPWTVLTYLVEGGKAKNNFAKSKDLIFNQTKSAHLLLEKLTDLNVDYLKLQYEAGCDALMIFDSWGGILTAKDYQQFSLQYCFKILEKIKTLNPDIPVILFTKGGGLWLDQMTKMQLNSKLKRKIGFDGLGLDWHIDIGQAKKTLKRTIALQGNLDPLVLLASDKLIKNEAKNILDSYYQANGSLVGHIFNLGHGISPMIKPEKLQTLIEFVHSYSQNLNEKR